MKKFVNLSIHYKNFLNKINDILVLSDNLSFYELDEIKKKVENNLEEFELQISDINHMMDNCEKPNFQIEKLKKLVYIRNYNYLKLILRSECWKDFIIKLRIKLQDKKNITIKQTEKLFLNLLQKYMNTWNSVDKFGIMNKKNQIKDIEIIDPEDYKFIINELIK